MANNETRCPEPKYLEKFVLGQLSVAEIEDCQQHLSQCDPCVETIATLKVDDTFTGIARQAWQSELVDSVDDQQAIEQMIQSAAGWKRDGLPETDSQDEANTNRSAEVGMLLREPIESGDIGALAHYRIQELLGTGSTGVVYLALDTKLDRQVVLKVLRPSLGEAARQRFVAEGRATAKLDHQNIVTIYEVGSDGPLSYLAMQWLPGQTLDEKLQREELLTVAEARALALQIATGLAAAHSRDLIHRDIKPANIWIPDGEGPARILDFGLVRIADEDPQLTCTGMIAGTPCFMSPEQSRGASIDVRSDLFSLGCVMYQCLTGQLPFRSDNALATLRSIQQDQPTEPSELNPAIDQATSDLVMCLLEKSPSRRPHAANSVVEALKCEDPADWGFGYEPIVKGKPAKTRGQFGFWKTVAALVIGIALGAAGLAYGQQIIRVVTNQGEIVIDSKVDDVKIEILQSGNVVKVIDLATRQSVEIKSGRYDIRPVSDDNSIRVENGSLILERGETEIVRITRDPAAQTMASNNEGPYHIQQGDVLGIFIDGIMGQFDQQPPIHYPAQGPPAVGFPMVVEHGGTIAIPLLGDIKVASLTIGQARERIKEACKTILTDHARIMVNLISRSDGPRANFASNDNSLRASSPPANLPSLPEFNQNVNNGESQLPVDEPNQPLLPANSVPKTLTDNNTNAATNTLDSVGSDALVELPSPYEVIPTRKEHEARIAELQAGIDELEAANASESELLNARIKLNTVKAYRHDNFDPEPLRQLMFLRQRQLELVDKELSKASDREIAELNQKRQEVRYQLGQARTSLFQFEKRQAIRPYTQPVYADEIYEHWYQVAQNERKLDKLIKAILSMATLAGDENQDEMMETVLNVASRGPGVAGSREVYEFEKTVHQVFAAQDAKTFANMLISELKKENRNRPTFVFFSDYAKTAAQKFGKSPGKNKDIVKQLVQALRNYAVDFGDAEATFNFMKQFESNWDQWDLSKLDAAKELADLYFDPFFKTKKFDQRIVVQGNMDLYFSYKFIAQYLPNTKGLSDLVANDLSVIRERANKSRDAGFGVGGGNPSIRTTYVSQLSQLANIIIHLPEEIQPRELLAECINDELQFLHEAKSNRGTQGWQDTYLFIAVDALGLKRTSFRKWLDKFLISEKSLELRLHDDGKHEYVEGE